jgi:hypothetical protein
VATIFDPAVNRIILDTTSVSAVQLWSEWIDWISVGTNSKYLPAFRLGGTDELGSGLFVPPYLFLQNGWRVRPMEADHTLIITGNLFVEGGGVPVVSTLGAFNVSAQYTVPVQAQGIATGGINPTLQQIRDAMRLPSSDGELSIDDKLRQPFLSIAI